MHYQFESVPENQEFIILDDIVFSINQIKTTIVRDFNQNNRNFNFCCKNKFLKTYFREINSQGIFNRIEWKFWLKQDIQCELVFFDGVQQVDELQIRVILDFVSRKLDSCDLKVLLDFSLTELEIEEKPVNHSVDISNFKYMYGQNTANFYPFGSEKICI